MKTPKPNSARAAFPAPRLAALLLALCALAAGASPSARPASAQDTVVPDTGLEEAGAYVIRNARVVTVSGADIENGAVVISQGRIAAVGPGVSAPPGAREIDARGLIVYPGMIDAGTSMALVEISSGAPGTQDTNELGEMNPNAAAYWAVNPHSAHIDVTRVAGVTNAVSLPSGGVISGQAALLNLAGTSQREMAVVPFAALVIDFPRIGGGGGFGGFLKKAAPVVVGGAAGESSGGGAGFKSKDELTLEYTLQRTGASTLAASATLKAKAKSDGEDLVGQLVNQAAPAVAAELGRK